MSNLFINISTLPFLLIFFFILKKIGVIKKEWAGTISFIGFKIGLTALIFLAFIQAPISINTLLNPIIGFLFSCSLFIVGFILVKIIKIQGNHRPIIVSSLVTFEGGLIGYPFFIAIFGIQNLPQIALLDLGMAIFAFTVLTFYFFRATNQSEKKLKGQFLEVLKIPLIWAMAIGLVINFLGFNKMMGNNVIGESILRLVANLGAIAIPLIMLSIVLNTDLTLKAVKKVLPFSLGSISVALILAIIWSFAWKFIPLSPLAKGALFIMAFLPPSLYPSMLAEGLNLADHEQKYAMQLYSVTIFVSIIFLLIFSSFLPKLITLW